MVVNEPLRAVGFHKRRTFGSLCKINLNVKHYGSGGIGGNETAA
jgi:hypothetical protein